MHPEGVEGIESCYWLTPDAPCVPVMVDCNIYTRALIRTGHQNIRIR